MKCTNQKTVAALFFTGVISGFLSAQTINIHSIVAARNGNSGIGAGYTLDGTWMSQGARLKLLNAANFGSNGTYSKTVNITDAFGTSGSLSQVSGLPINTIFFFGAFDKLDNGTQVFTSAEIDSLHAWSVRGGKMIICSGQLTSPQTGGPPYDSRILDLKWGLFWNYGNPGYYIPTSQGNSTDIFNGPFGSITGAYQGGSLQGYFNPVNPNTTTLATNPDGKATLIMDCNTLDLIIADVDGYTTLSNVTTNASILNDQDKFWANTIAFMDKLQPLPLISNNNNNLGLNAPYVNYQWYLNNQSIPGATASSFALTQTGSYHSEVTLNGGCKLKSNVLIVTSTVSTVGVAEADSDELQVFYPNPFNTFIQVDFKKEIKDLSIRIKDGSGREMRTQKFSGRVLNIEKEDLSSGTYFINILYEGKSILSKTVVII